MQMFFSTGAKFIPFGLMLMVPGVLDVVLAGSPFSGPQIVRASHLHYPLPGNDATGAPERAVFRLHGRRFPAAARTRCHPVRGPGMHVPPPTRCPSPNLLGPPFVVGLWLGEGCMMGDGTGTCGEEAMIATAGLHGQDAREREDDE
jgi:hypothetical protein